MGKALHMFWLFLTTFFSAAQKGAQTVENLTTITEEMSGAYLDQTRVDRNMAAIKAAKALDKLENKPTK